MLTPEFAAPEQLLGEGVGTATDIYRLGVLLYCLLTGMHPHGITAQTPLRQQLQLLEQPITRASTRAAKLSDDAARRHGGSPLQLVRLLRGDLDVILGKALQREPEARYPSAAAFRADLAAWLDGLPVAAREPTLRYRARRFVQRHRWAVAGSALALLAILAGSGAALWQAHRATLQAARADAVSDYLTGIFTSIDPEDGWGQNVSVRQLLDDGAHRLDAGALAAHPDAEAQLRGTLARTYTALGDYAAGRAQVRKALALDLDDPAHQLQTRLLRADLLLRSGEYDQAQAVLDALQRDLLQLAPGDLDVLNQLRDTQSELAAIREQPKRAPALAKAAYDSALARHGKHASATLAYQSTYAQRLRDAGESVAAVRLQRGHPARRQGTGGKSGERAAQSCRAAERRRPPGPGGPGRTRGLATARSQPAARTLVAGTQRRLPRHAARADRRHRRRHVQLRARHHRAAKTEATRPRRTGQYPQQLGSGLLRLRQQGLHA